METLHINLREIYPDTLSNDVFLDGLIYSSNNEMNQKRKAILIAPGGGYNFISEREKDPVMFAFASKGFNSFSLSYSLKTPYPIPHKEMMCAIFFINTHSEELNICKKDITLIGFSAGGHLVASYAYTYKLLDDEVDLSLIKPKAIILGYPVISLFDKGHPGSTKNITGNDEKLIELLSVERHVDKDYPPTFIWATKTDNVVNPSNTLMLVELLKKNKIKHKCIIYDKGPHGLALANHATCGEIKDFLNKDVEKWVDEACEFIFNL